MENLCCFLALILFFFLGLKLLFHGSRNLPPRPFALPIIGHLHLIKKPLHQSLEALSSIHGPILYLQFGTRPIVVISSPSAIEECFTKNDIILADRPRSMAGDSVTYNYTTLAFASYGHLWRILRRLTVVEVFSLNSVQKYSAVREEEVKSLCRRLFKLSSGGVEKVDLKFLFSLLTLNIMWKIIAGKRGVEEGAADNDLERQCLLQFKKLFCPSVSMNECDFFPILRLIGYKGLEKSLIRKQKMRDEYLQNLIEEIRLKKSSYLETRNRRDGEKKQSLVENLLRFQESDPEFYSDDIIKGIMLVMVIAGTDTTAVTLEWAMSLLLSHPETLQKLRAEIDCHVGHGHLLNDSDLTKLPYLRCVVSETLRLYPAAPLLIPHFSSENFTVGGYEVPQGTTVIVNAWAIHRDPNVWEDPTKFKPERFEGDLGEREGFKYVAFGAGRRACPGAALGIRTVSLALGALIQCFEWDSVEKEVDMSQAVGVTLSKAKPLEAMCHPRQNLIQLLSQL